MAGAVVWPSELPTIVIGGTSLILGENTVRSEVEQGPAQVRQRFTKSVPTIIQPFVLNEAQALRLVQFYKNATTDAPYGTGGGSMSFDFTEPITDNAAELRFLEKPTITLHASTGHWRTTCKFEWLDA